MLPRSPLAGHPRWPLTRRITVLAPPYLWDHLMQSHRVPRGRRPTWPLLALESQLANWRVCSLARLVARLFPLLKVSSSLSNTISLSTSLSLNISHSLSISISLSLSSSSPSLSGQMGVPWRCHSPGWPQHIAPPQHVANMVPYGHQWFQVNSAYQEPMAHRSDFVPSHGGPVYSPYGNPSTGQCGPSSYADGHYGPLPPRYSTGQQQPAGVYRKAKKGITHQHWCYHCPNSTTYFVVW